MKPGKIQEISYIKGDVESRRKTVLKMMDLIREEVKDASLIACNDLLDRLDDWRHGTTPIKRDEWLSKV